MDYKKVFCLHPGEYIQVHQEDEPWKTIDIDKIVREIVLGPQYNLQGGYLFDILLTGKTPQRSHCTPINITEDLIELYETFNTKWCPYELIFGNFNDQPIPTDYYDLLNDENGDENNMTGTTIDDVLLDSKGV